MSVYYVFILLITAVIHASVSLTRIYKPLEINDYILMMVIFPKGLSQCLAHNSTICTGLDWTDFFLPCFAYIITSAICSFLSHNPVSGVNQLIAGVKTLLKVK
jgi:hypothetical protein